MTGLLEFLGTLVALGTFGLAVGLVARSYFRLKGTRLVTCPETKKPAAVELDLRYAAATSAFGRPHLRLKDCSRWPERQACGQTCLAQLEEAPYGCLVRHILTDWYRSKPCALCRKPFGEIHWHDHKPALRRSDGLTLEWREIRPDDVPDALATHQPVCWNCHVAEQFRREHPELVVDRPYAALRDQPRA